MFEKILVALDRSSEATAVFEFALSVAQSQTSQMLLVHFIDWEMLEISPWVGLGTLYDIDVAGERYEWSQQRLQKETEQCKSWLETYTQKASSLEIDCKAECQVGNCNIGIVNRAKEWDADLIVIGRRGHKNISEILLGSVSNYVIHHAPCTVLVVQGTKALETDEVDRATEVIS